MPNIVVSGATHGIGRAIVEKFAAHDFDVAFFARSQPSLDKFSTKLKEQFKPVEVLTRKCDVSDKGQVKNFARDILERWKKVDILVNNAGVFIPGKIQEEEEGTFEKVMGTNINGVYYLTRAFLSSMIREKGGHIFNICSTASLKAYLNGGSYCISKHAVYGLSRVLREELKEYKIRVTSVFPGATFTKSWEGSELPRERFMEPDDVADMVFSAYQTSGKTDVEDLVLRPFEGDI